MTTATIGSIEDWRGELAGVSTISLAAGGNEDEAAKIALGVNLRAESDGEPGQPHCDWCGRSGPPAGLEDQSLGGPPVHECNDSSDCQSARSEREPDWLVNQGGKWWKVNFEKYQRVKAYEAEMAYRQKFGRGIYALTEGVDSEFALALAHIRDAVDKKAEGYLQSFERVGQKAIEQLELAAAPVPGMSDPATPQAPPEPVRFDPWGHTLAAAHNRTHLLGHHLQHKGVHDAAGAVARRNVLSRQAEDSA